MANHKTAPAGQLAGLAPERGADQPAARHMPAGQDKPEKWPARISMTASPDMKRDLELARVDDGIEVTARLRAMITLWQQDPELRARIDKVARDLR